MTSGTYTPEFEVFGPAYGPIVAESWYWDRVGDIVHVFGRFTAEWGGVTEEGTPFQYVGVTLPEMVGVKFNTDVMVGVVIGPHSTDLSRTPVNGDVRAEQNGSRALFYVFGTPFIITEHAIQFSFQVPPAPPPSANALAREAVLEWSTSGTVSNEAMQGLKDALKREGTL